MNLEELRSEIDKIDQELMQLLDQRLQIVKAVGEYKQKHQIEVLDQKREIVIVNKIKQMNLTNSEQIIQVYQSMMQITKDMQCKNMD